MDGLYKYIINNLIYTQGRVQEFPSVVVKIVHAPQKSMTICFSTKNVGILH